MSYKFLIYISYSYSIPIGNPLEEEIISRGYTVKWFGSSEEGQLGIKNKVNKIETIQEVVLYEPDIVLTITDFVPDFISGIKVQIFHGFPANKRKGTDQFKIRNAFDLYCTQGASSTNVFKKLSEKHKTFEVVETGWSKMDPLYPLQKKELSKKPTILIASTFTKAYSLALKEDIINEIIRLSNTGKWNFMIVLHPKLSKEVKENIKSKQNANFTYYDTTDLIPLFKKADLLISDTTSAIIEFLLQIKPVITIKNNMPGPYLIDISTKDEIENAINKALISSEELLGEIEKFADFSHAFKDGNSSKRVIDATINFLHKDKSHLQAKPLNLIRKYKIRKQLGYFTLKSFNKAFTKPLDYERKEGREKLTVIIPTGNEIHNIEAVIASVDFADEILIADSMSTDGTYEKAKKLDVKVIRREFKYFADHKNWAIPQAKYQWILLLDADERVTPELKEEVTTFLNDPSDDHVAYWIGRENYFMGKRVRHSGLKNDKVIRLFKRDECEYEDMLVHEEIITTNGGSIGKLKSKLYHDTYISFDNYIEKKNRYATSQARDFDKKTGKLTLYHFMIKPFWRFFKHFIIHGGFRDGVTGLTISYINAYSVFTRYVKIWLLRRGRE